MNLKKIQDSIEVDKTIVFHSTQSREELADVIFEKKFEAGRGGGKMLGPGFYANQHLRQAQKGNYGQYILKAQIYGIREFLILDKDIYEKLFGEAPDNFIYKQIEEAGLGDIIPKSFINANKNHGSTARLASPLWDRYGKRLFKKFGGFVYTGNYDYESVVCWYPEKQVRPLAWSDDKGKTWKPVKELSEYVTGSKKENLNKSEVVRSLQRAKDLISRYEKYPDVKLAHAIESQLSRVKDPTKREVRRDIIIKLLSELRPDVVKLLEK